jgi:hypothetical protein
MLIKAKIRISQTIGKDVITQNYADISINTENGLYSYQFNGEIYNINGHFGADPKTQASF